MDHRGNAPWVATWRSAIALAALLTTSTSARVSAAECTPEQNSQIQAAILVLGVSLAGAVQDIESIRQGGDASRFTYWFGGEASEDRLQVVELFLAAAYASVDSTYTCGFSFGCLREGAVAWVEHCQNLHHVYICDSFFSADFMQGQVGTLVHEYTHFVCSEDIDDFSEPEVAREYAINHPDEAIFTAVNLQFYVIDTR